jgi:hypothetical protein
MMPLFPLPHSSPALAELTSGLFAGSETSVAVFGGDSGRFLACLVAVRLLVSGCGVSMNSGCGVPVGERMPPTLLLPAQEASAAPNTTTPIVLAMTLIFVHQQTKSDFCRPATGPTRFLALFKALVYLIGRCWAAPSS